MADLSEDNIKQIRQVVREEISGVEGNVSTLQSDVSTLQSDVSTLQGDVSTLQGDVSALRTGFAGMRDEQRRQSVLLEDLDSQFKAVAELISSNLKVKKQVDDHETRLTGVEADKKLIKSTVALHSRQIKALQG